MTNTTDEYVWFDELVMFSAEAWDHLSHITFMDEVNATLSPQAVDNLLTRGYP